MHIYSLALKMDYVFLIYSNEFERKILTFHTLLFFDNDAQDITVWRMLFSYL